jgi:hypothetical protein
MNDLILKIEDCLKIENDTHEKYNKNDGNILDNFKTRKRIQITFTDKSSFIVYEGVFEIGSSVTKNEFNFKEVK